MAMTGTAARNGQGWPSHLPGLLGPAVAALVVTFATKGRAGVRRLLARLHPGRVPLWGWGVVVATGGLCLLPLLTHGSGDPLSYSGAPTWGPAVLLYVLVVNGIGEELGWRGYLVEELAARMRLTGVAVTVWAVWALWHLPLFLVVTNLRDLGWGGRLGWLLGLLCGSVVLTWLYLRGGRSVLLVAVWHLVFNLATATDWTAGVPAAVASTVVMVGGVVVLALPSSWRRPGVVGAPTAPGAPVAA